MNKEKSIRTIYESVIYGIVRVYYDAETEELLYCAKDVAKLLGFADPCRSVRSICLRPVRVAFETEGGMQRLNFIDEVDVERLYAHAPAPDAEDVMYFLDDITNDFYAELDAAEEKEMQTADAPAEMDAQLRAMLGEDFLKKVTAVLGAVDFLDEALDEAIRHPELLIKLALLLRDYKRAHGEA